MQRFKNILLYCDFATRLDQSVKRAVSLAAQNQARLTLLSVVRNVPDNMGMAIIAVPPQELFQKVLADTRDNLDELAEDIRQLGVHADTRVVSGTAFVEVIRHVLRNGIDLVILAAEGKSGIKQRLFGSTSMQLMRKCPCPVWVVKPEKRTRYCKIMAAVDVNAEAYDDSQTSLNPLIVELASSMAKTDDSELHIVQVWSIYGESYLQAHNGMSDAEIRELRKKTRNEYSHKIDELLEKVDTRGLSLHRHLPRDTDIPGAIVKLEQKQAINLLVMGTVCRTGLSGFFIGNTAEKVLSEVSCSVLTVKPGGFVSPVELD